MAATPQSTTPPPILSRDFTAICDIYEQAGLVPWGRISEARRALRALCAEADTERERYRRETIERAREVGEDGEG